MKFRAIQDFFSEETRSQYCEGLTYTVRTEDEVLAGLLQQWVKDGMIEVIDPNQEPPMAEVQARGDVK